MPEMVNMFRFFLIFCSPNLIRAELKLVIVYGQISGNTTSRFILNSWDDCLKICFWDSNCLAVQKETEGCLNFSYGTFMIERLASPSEFIVAFKRNETENKCPLKKFPLVFNSMKSEWLVNKTIYSLEFYSDDPYFYFNYTVSICPENSILSTRVTSNGTFYVCLEVRFFSDGICWLYEDAQKLCNENNGMGLTGHFQPSEFDYFSKRMINNSKYNEEYLPKSMNGMPETTWQLGIFIDGRSLDESNPKNFNFEDKTHEGTRNYQFFPGYPSRTTVPSYILIVTYANIPSTIDATCTSDDFPPCNGNYYCPRGAACRVSPSIIR